MNPQNNAIIIYDNRLEKDVDKCDDIKTIISAGAKLDIVFYGNDRVFSYNRSSVRWITNPLEINLIDKLVYLNGVLLYSAKKILQFEDWYKIFYENGKHCSYHSKEITIKRTVESEPLIKDTLSYLKRVAEYLKSEDDGGDFLASQIEKLRPVDGCALARFLQQDQIKSKTNADCLIYPFGCNYSQIQAVKKAFSNDFSVIQGPPGTGKTQTILSIVSNAILMGKTVAVVSGNNEATRNVSEKLDKNGLAFLTAFLGNKDNIEKFFLSPPAISEHIVDWKQLELVNEQQLNLINSRLEETLLFQIQIPILRKRIAELRIEKTLNDVEYSMNIKQVPAKIMCKRFTSQSILKYAALLEFVAGKNRIRLLTKIKYFFKHGINLTKTILSTLGDTIDYLHNKYYVLKLEELETELRKKESIIKEYDIGNLKEKSQVHSRNALYKFVGEKYCSNFVYDSEIRANNYRSRFENFTKRYPIIFSTTNALQYCTGEGFLYDYLIIDESSQVNIVTACIAFACAKTVVLVGDKMQLPHVVKSDDILPLKGIFAGYSLPKEIEYSSHSILDAVTKMYGKSLPSTLLNEHYRCDPQIIGFCNKRFYDDSLVIQTIHKNDDCGIKIITTEAHHASNRTNIRQAEILEKDILSEIGEIKNAYDNPDKFTVGIVAPYRNQVELLKKRFSDKDFLIDTVHKFQGKEKTVVIMSTVSDRITKYDDEERVDFLNNPNLINVAISRAESILYIVASSELIEQEGSLLHDLAKYNDYYCSGGIRRHTKVYSVFDLMFEEYSNVLQSLKNRLLRISKHESENIVGTVIDDICKSKKYGLIKFHHNYQLRKVLNIDSIDNDEDLKFIKNPNTHCDFIIFDMLNKEIRLAVEVDGRQHNDPVQKARDERKDRLLTAAGVRILRLPTTSVECREKIEIALQ